MRSCFGVFPILRNLGAPRSQPLTFSAGIGVDVGAWFGESLRTTGIIGP